MEGGSFPQGGTGGGRDPDENGPHPKKLKPTPRHFDSSEDMPEEILSAIDDPSHLRTLVGHFNEKYSVAKRMLQGVIEDEMVLQERLQRSEARARDLEALLQTAKDANEKVKEEFYSSVFRILEMNFRCPVCSEVFIEPTVLDCSHIFCNYCIKNWAETRRRDCPLCRKQNVRGTLHKQYELGVLIEQIQIHLSPEIRERRQELISERLREVQRRGRNQAFPVAPPRPQPRARAPDLRRQVLDPNSSRNRRVPPFVPAPANVARSSAQMQNVPQGRRVTSTAASAANSAGNVNPTGVPNPPPESGSALGPQNANVMTAGHSRSRRHVPAPIRIPIDNFARSSQNAPVSNETGNNAMSSALDTSGPNVAISSSGAQNANPTSAPTTQSSQNTTIDQASSQTSTTAASTSSVPNADANLAPQSQRPTRIPYVTRRRTLSFPSGRVYWLDISIEVTPAPHTPTDAGEGGSNTSDRPANPATAARARSSRRSRRSDSGHNSSLAPSSFRRDLSPD